MHPLLVTTLMDGMLPRFLPDFPRLAHSLVSYYSRRYLFPPSPFLQVHKVHVHIMFWRMTRR